jgi:hypothetical protein
VNNKQTMPEVKHAAAAAAAAAAAEADCQQQWQPDWWSWQQQQQQQQQQHLHAASSDVAHINGTHPMHASLQQNLGYLGGTQFNQPLTQAASNHQHAANTDLGTAASSSLVNHAHSNQQMGADMFGAIASLLSQWYTAGSDGSTALQNQQILQQQQQQQQQ